jgi:protein-S-isoprenylcysteine O-methyltransferase Ste14
MTKLTIKALGGLLFLVLILGIILLFPSFSLSYWQAWVYLGLFFLCTLLITLYLMKKDTGLLQRRVSAGPVAEKQQSQKIIQSIAQFSFIAVYLVSRFDHQGNWSYMPEFLVFIGDILVITGFFIVFRVFRENTFTSATIEVDKEQLVVSTGPYSLVRHPMYSGALIMLLGTPLALDSLWGLPALIPMILIIITRLLEEEKFLAINLHGYTAYQSKVKYRLIPGVY